MSVDMLDNADLHRLTALHDQEGRNRLPSRGFHGWYVFVADSARSVGWDVHSRPTAENPWHAEVLRPVPEEDKDDFLENCNLIASYSNWLPRAAIPADS